MRQIQQVNFEKLGFHERLQYELSRYPEKNIHEDGSVTINAVKNSYFLTNDSWNIEFLGGIKQFEDTVAKYKNTSKNIHFRLSNPIINLEVKYVYYQQLFNDYWTITSIFMNQNGLRRMTEFINDKYPNLSSILELEIEKAEKEYLFWLNEKGINTLVTKKKVTRKDCIIKTTVAAFLRIVYTALFQLTDIREEWEKDRWDVRVLHDSYGIAYNKSINVYHIDFTKIENVNIRGNVKKYIKQRLLSNNNFSWSTAFSYLNYLPSFFSFIISLEPSWIDLKALQRAHMEKYIQWLNKYAKNNLKRKNSHPEHHVLKSLTIIGKFLEDIQLYEYNIAPKKNMRLLLFPEDKPKLKKKSIDQVDYIPDFVLDQLFTHINDLHKEVIPVVWIAFKTGLRISDVLGLTSNCLECLNGKYSIVTDIEKTYVQGHRIPIDDELANILAVLIQKSKENSNQDNNPEGFIFIRYRGIRKGKPFSQNWVREQLNKLAIEKNIVDENGNLFHFKTHQFRHTYAIKMLNNGADILTVQALLAHASPEMTLRYAKLLDDTKRKAFESVINQGVFSFNLNGDVQEINAGDDIPEEILQAIWQDHKLNAMDNPYGTCHARLKGNCSHMEAPPCLTCNGGSPCKDLAIGFSELDIQKYELHIKTTSKSIEAAKQYGRNDVVEKQERNLQRYQGILNNIQEGSIIFGRQDRVKIRARCIK